ncbi:MBL fold metallo-hydrolase [Sphaerisporangium melleum]|uniref:MBL fold metallo-hydrolase n=1 Tax=Sphaerisporangium melleum TaxID=321316 RepID=A0A917QZR2_9ACTN|nr:MBL fold metallo-hydrolase [Sphaerisporangium melleum]GGK79231.1 MBL fold metallo-hydrolase [Sphaerisporangium melleum]GII69730.1 MBL fold metallo-hydrolase [Sphaerisporangium melleum]
MRVISQQPVDATPGAAALHEIVPGVLAWVQPDGTWWVNNAGAVTGDDGVILIDTCATEQRTRRFLDAVSVATGGAPVRVAVNTHQHGDHSYGNSLLPASAVIVGHEAMREGLLVDPIIDGCPPVWSPVPDWGAVTRRVPDITLRSELTVFTGSRRVELRHPGHPAHTTGDVIAWLPEERVLFTGDLIFHGLTPLVFMGSVEGALRSLDWMAALEPEHIVPGHGPVFGAAALPDVLAAHERYYRLVLATAEHGRAAGLTPLQAAQACDLGEFAGWADAERLVLNLHRAYRDAAGEGEVDLLQAFGDAIAFHGGPLPTSV